MKVDVFLATYNRPWQIKRFVDSVRNASHGHELSIYVLLEEDDRESYYACEKIEGIRCIINSSHCVPRAVNNAIKQSHSEFILYSHDRAEFKEGFLEEPFKLVHQGYSVIGIPCGNVMPEGTFFLIRREYIEQNSCCVDIPNVIFNPNYHHYYADTELYYTSTNRGVYKRCEDILTFLVHDEKAVETHIATAEKDFEYYKSRRGLFRGV